MGTSGPSFPPPARILDGRALAAEHRARLAERVKSLGRRRAIAEHDHAGTVPPAVRLDAVLVGADDNAARLYAESQARTCAELGIAYRLHELPARATYDDIAGRVLLLNTQPDVTAIMVHLPLPEGVDPYSIQRLIAPEKDVEGVNPANIGNIVYGRSSLAPCTALAAVRMIESTKVDLTGKTVVIVGASNHVGKPIAVLLMRAEATVISCNKHTRDLADLTRRADVLVAAAGVPGLITAEMVKPRGKGGPEEGAIVVDVGVNRVTDPDGRTRTVGDVAFEEVSAVAGWISPVPGGVGPMTVAMLLGNVVDAAERAGG